jgi:hypothetical protein
VYYRFLYASGGWAVCGEPLRPTGHHRKTHYTLSNLHASA